MTPFFHENVTKKRRSSESKNEQGGSPFRHLRPVRLSFVLHSLRRPPHRFGEGRAHTFTFREIPGCGEAPRRCAPDQPPTSPRDHGCDLDPVATREDLVGLFPASVHEKHGAYAGFAEGRGSEQFLQGLSRRVGIPESLVIRFGFLKKFALLNSPAWRLVRISSLPISKSVKLALTVYNLMIL